MKKLLTMVFALGVIVFLTTSAHAAAVFTFTFPELAGMSEVYDDPSGKADLDTTTQHPGGVLFVGDTDDSTTIWREIGIGYTTTGSERWADLSDYTGYALNFKNVNNEHWYVNMWLTTNGTTYTYPSWVELAPYGGSTYMLLDFASLGVTNLDSVDDIGFMIGWDDDTETYEGSGLYQGDKYHMQVGVPEPASMVLFGLGLLGFGSGVIRKRFKA